MRNPINVLLFLGALLGVLILGRLATREEPTDRLSALKEKYSTRRVPSVDHAKLPELQREFKTPQEVTRACVSCHTERHKEIMQSPHWLWQRESYIPGRGVVYAGKRNLINNYCIGIGGSEQSCNRCHAGFGWEDKTFDFTNYENVDCMVCHDNSGEYVKGVGLTGYPEPDVNLTKVAQGMGLPKMANCGGCHFYGGGGNNVKHGDLEEGLFTADRKVDVHLGVDGVKMQCVDCHEAENHKMQGQMFSVSSNSTNRLHCDKCHSETPHDSQILNEHTVKVACQTCHIPVYAKVNATKMRWDWSTAGKMKDGKPYAEHDENGNDTYLSIKGSFVWKKNVQPEYVWFNGSADHYFIGDKVDTTQVIPMNTLQGEYKDPQAKIIPVKIHRARQIYDCENKFIIQPKLYSEEKGGGGYWKDFDWNIAAKLGQEYVNEPYSGHFCFVSTEMSWPLNHMVSRKEESLNCKDCHTREGGRLAALNDFYMPGRDASPVVDKLGSALAIITLIGVVAHGLLRALASRSKGRK